MNKIGSIWLFSSFVTHPFFLQFFSYCILTLSLPFSDVSSHHSFNHTPPMLRTHLFIYLQHSTLLCPSIHPSIYYTPYTPHNLSAVCPLLLLVERFCLLINYHIISEVLGQFSDIYRLRVSNRYEKSSYTLFNCHN